MGCSALISGRVRLSLGRLRVFGPVWAILVGFRNHSPGQRWIFICSAYIDRGGSRQYPPLRLPRSPDLPTKSAQAAVAAGGFVLVHTSYWRFHRRTGIAVAVPAARRCGGDGFRCWSLRHFPSRRGLPRRPDLAISIQSTVSISWVQFYEGITTGLPSFPCVYFSVSCILLVAASSPSSFPWPCLAGVGCHCAGGALTILIAHSLIGQKD